MRAEDALFAIPIIILGSILHLVKLIFYEKKGGLKPSAVISCLIAGVASCWIVGICNMLITEQGYNSDEGIALLFIGAIILIPTLWLTLKRIRKEKNG